MQHLIETNENGITNCGDPLVGYQGKSEFSIMAESIRLEVEHDAINDGEDPNSLPVKLDIAIQVAALRLSMYTERSGQNQSQVAARLGISRGHCNRLIHGKAAIEYSVYQRLAQLETIDAILMWIDRTKTDAEKDRFEALFGGVRIFDPYARVLFCMGACFGGFALQEFRDSGNMTPIPKEADAPEALSAAIRKAVA